MSSSTIMAVAVARAIVAPCALVSTRLKCSLASSSVSGVIGIEIVLVCSPAAKVMEPLPLLKAIIDATAYAQKQENRKEIAKAIAPQNYLNQPETVLEQILTGTYADGLGGVKKDPNRIGFDPFPWNQFAIWILSQMKRWGQLKGDVDYARVAAEVFLATDTAAMMKEMGLTPPDPSKKTIVVMGKPFDPAKPAEYVNSFAIKRT